MSRRFLVTLAVCGIVPAALLATLVIVPVAAWSRLPHRLGDHWDLTGTVNGSAVKPVPFLAMGVIAVAGCAVIGWAAFGRGPAAKPLPGRPRMAARSWLAAAGMLLASLGTAGSVMITVANLGVRNWRDTSVGVTGLLVFIAGPAALAAAAGWALRRYAGLGATDDGTPRPSLGLRGTEQALWVGRASARWPAVASVVVMAAAVWLAFAASWQAALPVFVAAILPLGFTTIRVTAGRQGVTVAYGFLGLKLTRIPLERIVTAEAVDFTAFTFGYRGSLAFFGGAVVSLRRGPALSLILRQGKSFVVTVDDAATGAALLNDVLARTTAPSSPLPPG
jgi:hypothetical protein